MVRYRVGIGSSNANIPARLAISGSGAYNTFGAARLDLFNTVDNSGFLQHVSDSGDWQIATSGGATRMVIDGFGNVGIGTASPGARLTVSGSGAFNATAGMARFDLVNPVWGSGISQYLTDTGLWQIARTDGTTRMVINPSGNVGIGTATPSAQLQIAGTGTNGFALGVEGNVTQNLDKGGFIKALVFVNPFLLPQNYIVRCWNGVTGASTGNCGFSVTRTSAGNYRVHFGFPVNNRFLAVSSYSGVTVGANTCCDPDEVGVGATNGSTDDDTAFFLIIF
jgi:hypothetical protein